ncbi:hypothetical protein CsSME_00046247 [Camellia sinensis var. sinensis]
MYMCSFIAFFMKQINRLPPEVVKYFTDPNAIEPPDMQLLFPFVELCPGIWCPGGSAISQSITHLELAILEILCLCHCFL